MSPGVQVQFGRRIIGRPASVVGVISAADRLRELADAPDATPCHVVEMRLGELDPAADWSASCARLAAAGRPVLATLRNQAEGGRWRDADPERLHFYARALECCAAVDVEWASTQRDAVLALARAAGKPVVLSFHDFHGMPALPALLETAHAMARHPNVVAKFAVQVQDAAEIALLRQLLHAPFPAPRCVIAMGAVGASTRIDFAREGSCLTYGWLDHPTAPGQPSCRDLMQALA
jgi:3-dehydroquinate dehydratase I